MGLEDSINKVADENLFKEQTEMGQVMDNLDNDVMDDSTGMSKIDFNTRLESVEINSIMIIDEFVRLGILPDDIGLTRQKKRLSVSLRGMGRTEKVQIVAGNREQQQGMGFGERIGNLFKRRE